MGSWFLRAVTLAALILHGVTAGMAQGYVCAVGGGGENYTSWSDAPYRWIVQRADSQRIIILAADPADSWLPTYFRSLGADTAFNLTIGSIAVANDSATFRAITDCRGVFIKGGDQWDYVRDWRGTLTEEAIRSVFMSGGVVAGTSAGAAVLGEFVYDARTSSAVSRTVLRNPRHSSITITTDFLGLVPGCLFDSHFYERARFGRLLAMIARLQADSGRQVLGIGLEAETALCISPDGQAEVMGAGSVVFYAPTAQTRVAAVSGQPLIFTDIRMDALVAGYRYDLTAWQTGYVPPGATVPGPGTTDPVVNPITLIGDPFPAPVVLSDFLASAGGGGGDFVVVTSPSTPATGQRFVDTLLGRGVSSAALVLLDTAAAQSAANAALVSGAEGVIFAGNLREQFPPLVDSTTLVGQTLRARLQSGLAVAFVEQDTKLAGSVVVFRTELEEYASIRGKLTTGSGLRALRNLAVMPLIFQSSVYDENRTAGLCWGMAATDAKTGVYLDEGGTVTVSASGEMTANGPTPAIIVDAGGVPAVGFSTYRHSGSVGPRQSTAMVGARLHVISGDVRFDAVSGSIVTGVREGSQIPPDAHLLLTGYPNPFNGEATLSFRVEGPAPTSGVELLVFDLLGREVAELVRGERPPGVYTARFDASALASGLYIVRLRTPGSIATAKLLHIR